jgi:hypothetical protein
VAHLGDTIQYVVAADGGADLIARAPRGEVTGMAVGSAVTCSWAADAVRVFGAAQAHLVAREPASRRLEPVQV